MKTPIITLATLLMVACGVKQTINSTNIATPHSKSDEAHLAADKHPAPMPDYFEYDFDNDDTIDKAEKEESVIGDFNGDGKSEYAALYHYSKPIPEFKSHQFIDDYYHFCKIHFSDDTLTRIQLVYVGCNLVNEGDLNGDGSDELGFFNVVGNTRWGNYSVLTFVDGEWHELVCIRHNASWNPAPYQDLVRKDPHNDDYIIIKKIRLDDGKIMDNRILLANLTDAAEQTCNQTYPTKEIDDRLTSLLAWERDTPWKEYELKNKLQMELESEVVYYLHNPITFTDSMPLLEKEIDVITVPSGKAKIYNYWIDGGGTMNCDRNFIQYLDAEGYVHCTPYLNDLRYPRGICDVWEFELDGTLYYAIKTYHRGASGIWDYYLEVITIDNGSMQVCKQFFDEINGHIWDSEEYYIYDNRGDIVDQAERECWYIRVCGTQNCNTNVDFDFDPKTLTVKVKDDADWTESRTGAIEEREWRLDTSRMGLKFDFTVTDAEGFDGWSDISLSLTNGDKECFNGEVGRVQYFEYAEEDFFPRCENGAITAPDEVLFFADIDFDGRNELITGSMPFAGTQRDLPRFCSIYKLMNGKYIDATDEFTSRCEAFNMIEPYNFIVDYRDKLIVHYNDGGYMSGGWEVYKYHNGRYTYDRYVHFERDSQHNVVDITVSYNDGRPTRNIEPASYIFDEHKWRYE